ncbi:stage 0 sporulation family protein [Oscillospiraceae bacterium OttesenSCG-928-F05]|nr:stage 0 sporulation family protein [Oscillospiraceae bacterium OttesenSCG-928-F05]
MTEVIGVRFKSAGKVYYFDPAGVRVEKGAAVVVETSRGTELGECTMQNCQVDDDKVVKPLRKLVRPATEEDLKRAAEFQKKEKKALLACQKKADEHKLDMKIVDVSYAFDGSKIIFYFTADGRVDFRELVKDLASVFRARIELRQIGVRDEAKMLGGLGICGRPFCCASFLEEFHPVSIKMAKEQSLSLNPTKISGTCGRLMCCLKYEQDAYVHLRKTTPTVDSLVKTPDGEGTVVDVNLLRRRLKVRLANKPDDVALQMFSADDVTVLRPGRRKPGGKRPDSGPGERGEPAGKA